MPRAPFPMPCPLPTAGEIITELQRMPADTPIAATWALAMHEPRAVVLADVLRRLRAEPLTEVTPQPR